jgi:sarcosine oxidase subunit alpha
MLSSAVREYLGTYAVLAGQRAVIFTNNDDAYRTAHALLDAGGQAVAVVDSRPEPPGAVADAVRARSVRILSGHVVATHGRPALTAVTVRDTSGREVRLDADLLAISGGRNPTVHLFSQSGGQLEWDVQRAHFKPGRAVQATQVVGSAAGGGAEVAPLWKVEARGKAFVDFQNDVTTDDIALAARENFVSVEHLKRYTTLGMAPDQGKTANVNALALMGELTGRDAARTGTTRYRFPYTPVTFGAMTGVARGELARPLRRLPAHEQHVAMQASFEEFSSWLRPAHYLRAGESSAVAEQREALAVRTAAGLFDASPLGKIEVKGADAGEFLDRLYANTMSTLKVGCLRYGLMLNELGVIIDDGVTARLAEDHFLVGTTSAGADRIASWLEECAQCEWPDLQVVISPVTTAIGVLTLSGPKARAILQAVGVDFAIGAADFPHMTLRGGSVADMPARVCRVSFTGEISYEINVAASRTSELWQRLMEAGAPHGLTAVGIDAWMLLRTEKGYVHVGADTDGTTVPDDIGWGHVLKRDRDFIGRRSLTLPAMSRADRLQFVGLEPLDGAELPVGSHLRGAGPGGGSEGYITSAGFSPALKRWVALAMLRSGRTRQGETVSVVAQGRNVRARVTVPGAYDREGARLRE